MLEQWNIMIHANITLPLTLLSNKLNVPFFSTLFQWDKKCNCFEVYFWRNNPKIVSKFWKSHLTSHKALTRTNVPVPSVISVLLNHKTVTNVDQSLPMKWHIFLIGNTHRSNACAIIWFMVWLVCLEPVTTCRYDSMIKWRHHCTSV